MYSIHCIHVQLCVTHTRYGDIVQYASLSFPMEVKPNSSCSKLLTKENLNNRYKEILFRPARCYSIFGYGITAEEITNSWNLIGI